MTRRRQRGSSVLYIVVLSPIIMLSLALALEAGALQMEKQRLRSAADVATLTAASGGAVGGNQIGLDVQATDASIRQALADNLTPLSDQIAGATPQAIAEAAQVFVVTDVPAADPLDPSRLLTRPTVETRLRVPVRSGLLSVAGIPDVLTLTVTSSADLRVIGGTQQ